MTIDLVYVNLSMKAHLQIVSEDRLQGRLV